MIEGLKVENDVTGRGVKIASDSPSSASAREGQLQQLLQVAKKLRREVTVPSKSSLARLERRHGKSHTSNKYGEYAEMLTTDSVHARWLPVTTHAMA